MRSVYSLRSNAIGLTPRYRLILERVSGIGVKAMTRASGRYLLSSLAVLPDSVKATMVSIPRLAAASTAAPATAEANELAVAM